MATAILQNTTYAPSRSSSPRISRSALWTSRVITGVVALLLAFDAGIKLIQAKPAIEGSAQLGFGPTQVLVIGVVALVCLVLYLVPRTAPLGAVLWTGYFGGAVVTHLRVGNPLFTHILSGVYVSTLIWVSLYLRDPRVRALLGKR